MWAKQGTRGHGEEAAALNWISLNTQQSFPSLMLRTGEGSRWHIASAGQENQAVSKEQILQLLSSSSSALWRGQVALLCLCCVLTPLIYTQRLCHHQHLQAVGGGEPSAPVGGHEGGKHHSGGMWGKVSKMGRFSRTDPPANIRAEDFAGETFSEDGLCWEVRDNIMKSEHCPHTGLMIK